jgi:hypothetical protein
VADGETQDRPFGAGRADHGHHDLDQRALARAVWAEQAKDLPSPHAHLDSPQRVHAAAVDLFDAGEIDGKFSVAHAKNLVTRRPHTREQFTISI